MVVQNVEVCSKDKEKARCPSNLVMHKHTHVNE